MAATPQQTGPIAVYGATGYTGRLVAAELHRRGADSILAGRNRAKLEIVAEDIGGDVPRRAVALDDPAGLHELLEPCGAVIACAGPFREHGEPVLAAAVATGTRYLDTTGEQPFIRKVFDEYGPLAEYSGAALVPAMGFDYAPGDMIAALTAEGMGELDEIDLAYAVTGFRPSRGTLLSALGMLGGPSVEWSDGELRPATPGGGAGTFEFPDPVGRQRMIRYPAGEHITVPRHVPTRNVYARLAGSTVSPYPRLALFMPALTPAIRLITGTPLRRGVEALAGWLPEGPSAAERGDARFTVVCDARAGGRRRRGIVSGFDVYGLTARTTVEAALLCAAPGFDRAGALAPSEAFDPREFLRALGTFDVTYEIVPLPRES